MNLNFRKMTIEDIDNVYAIEIQTHTSPWHKKILRDCVLIGYDCHVLEMHQNNQFQVVGYSITRIKDGIAHLLNYCINKPYQAQGLGKALLIHLEKAWKLAHVNLIQLEVRPSNLVAIRLYQSMGFILQEVKKEYYTDDDSKEDALLFTRKL